MTPSRPNLLVDAPQQRQAQEKSVRRGVIVAVIVILLVAVGVGLNWVTSSASRRASDAQRLAAVTAIQGALFRYAIDHAVYPAGQDLLIGEGGSCANLPCIALLASGFSNSSADNAYFFPLPQDGLAGSAFVYTQQDGGRSYRLRFRMLRGAAGYPAGVYDLTPQGLTIVP